MSKVISFCQNAKNETIYAIKDFAKNPLYSLIAVLPVLAFLIAVVGFCVALILFIFEGGYGAQIDIIMQGNWTGSFTSGTTNVMYKGVTGTSIMLCFGIEFMLLIVAFFRKSATLKRIVMATDLFLMVLFVGLSIIANAIFYTREIKLTDEQTTKIVNILHGVAPESTIIFSVVIVLIAITVCAILFLCSECRRAFSLACIYGVVSLGLIPLLLLLVENVLAMLATACFVTISVGFVWLIFKIVISESSKAGGASSGAGKAARHGQKAPQKPEPTHPKVTEKRYDNSVRLYVDDGLGIGAPIAKCIFADTFFVSHTFVCTLKDYREGNVIIMVGNKRYTGIPMRYQRRREYAMKNRLTVAILVLSIAVSLLPLGSCGASPESTAAYVTRGQWVAMLTEKFGLDTYHSDAPYYADVTASDELFSAVQSAADWGVLSVYSKKTLDIDKLVTRQEVASTAAIAAGFGATEDSQAAVKYALANGIIQADEGLQAHMTQEDCVAAVEAAQSIYLNDPGEEKMIVVPNEDVVDLRGVSGDNITISENRITFSPTVSGEVTQDAAGNSVAAIDGGNGIVRVQTGNVLVAAPSPKHPMGVAYKITAIEGTNGEVILTTESPTLADLYEELDVHTTVSANTDAIIWANGVSEVATSTNELSAAGTGEYSVQLLSHQNNSPKATYLGQNTYTTSISRDFTFQEGECQKTWTGNNSGVLGGDANAKAFESTNFVHADTPSIEDFNGSKDSWTKSLPSENKFSAGYKITGNISINSLSVTTDIEYHKADLLLWEVDTPIPEAASLQISSDISATLKLEGNLNEQLKIATIPIPIAATGLVVSVDLYLYVDASGALQVQTALSYNAKVEWQAGTQLKRTQRSTTKADLALAVDIGFGGDLAASLGAFGLDIMDVGAQVGGNLSASAYVEGKCEEGAEDGVTTLNYQESIHTKADLYAPIVTLYAGSSGTLLGDVGVGGSWEVVGKDKGAACFPLVNNEWVFWEKTVTLDENGEVVVPEVVLTNTYTTKARNVSGIVYPSTSFDYPDGWTITKEYVDSVGEWVQLTNEWGIDVVYEYRVPSHAYGNMVTEMGTETSKVANSSFAPEVLPIAHHLDLGKFVVAKVRATSWKNMRADPEPIQIDPESYSYAVMPESECGSNIVEGCFFAAFHYGGYVSFSARVSDALTSQETQEVIAILASFRVSSNEDLGIDFSVLAGTYIPYLEEEYEGATNLTLYEDGSIIGAETYNGDVYPLTSSGEKPLSVVINEDGSYTCILSWQEDFPTPGDLAHTGYLIFPPNVPSFFWTSTNPDLNEGKTRIYYNHSGGGVNGILYYKADE